MPSAEVTFRTACAAECIKAMHDEVPEINVGAGTVLTVEQVDEAVAAGAGFIVSPGFDADVVKRCIELNVPVLPGTVTPSEVTAARKLGLTGETRGNVAFGIDYLVNPSSVHIGDEVAVIGVGNVAMDVARQALRHGARKVTLYARSKHVSASSDEVEYAELEGAEIAYGKAICAIDENGPVFRTAIFDEDDKVTGYEEQLDHVHADTVIIAASQQPKNKLVLTTDGLCANDRGLLEVGEDGQTTVPGVFAAGDVVVGPLTVVHAVAGAKVAVAGMLAYLGLE